MGNSSSKQKSDDFENDSDWITPGVPTYSFHPLPHGMVGMTVRDLSNRFVSPEAHALGTQLATYRNARLDIMQRGQSSPWWKYAEPLGPRKSGLATRGTMKGNDMGEAPGNSSGVGALGMTQTSFSGQERVSKRQTNTKSKRQNYTKVNVGHKSEAGSYDGLHGLKEARQKTSDSDCIEWDMTCEEASKSAEMSGRVEQDVETQKLLRETAAIKSSHIFSACLRRLCSRARETPRADNNRTSGVKKRPAPPMAAKLKFVVPQQPAWASFEPSRAPQQKSWV
ncbi:MAG: hypothetical protein Q9182_005528 [Xanthomendoza sp. 2 TL-2023]